ncbi:leucine Rich Repeat Protein [Aspergillus sclerotialis]|uniref:Leucine Rich Repeat Protein n=1 Tax=Aspergillus sclerotialis TaxID=2070753 RepID=A0A3A2ZY75_9EURO|nr:leucine Rich Repeat Protein [Aspergillus sclerotialis]
MEDALPSYESATARDAWPIVAQYIPSSDLCAASLVCQRWHRLFMPFLWGDPASHFGTDNDAVYVALTRFRRTLKYARLEVRMLTHTLHLPPALSEIYDGPRPGWLKEILEYLPCLQSLMVSKLPFFDHNAMIALRSPAKNEQSLISTRTYNIRLLLARREPNTTSQGLSEGLMRFPELIYLDLSYTKPARDHSVLSILSQLEHLQVLKLRGIGLKDSDAQFLGNAIGIRVRILDLRDNMLTDMAVRSLLQASFLPPDNAETERSARRGILGTSNAVPRTALSSSSADFLKRPDLDEQLVKLLSHPLVGRSWIEDLPHVGITHLYVANNQLTVEGVASLLASTRLHVLDAGTVNTASSLPKGPSALSPHNPEESHDFPGAEKLIPVIGSSAKDNLTYIRAHHALVTADVPFKDPASPNALLPELLSEGPYEEPGLSRRAELDATDEVHELAANADPIFELADTSIPPPTGKDSASIEKGLPRLAIYEDEPVPPTRRGSVFAPEVVNLYQGEDGPSGSHLTLEQSVSTTFDISDRCSEFTDPTPQCGSPLSTEDPRSRRIQELLAKRPRNQTLPRRDRRDTNFPYLHPSNVPHLETFVLTDVPSHVPADSPLLDSLIRFITACSNEALLATLQAGTDYSLPPGQSRLRAEQQRARSLFALRRLVLEITPVSPSNSLTRLTSWKPSRSHSGVSSTGDQDLEKMWSEAMDDFSFFGETECGIPDNDPGKYFPMAVLNEKVSLMPEEDDSVHSGTPTKNASFFPNSRDHNQVYSPTSNTPQVEAPLVDVVAELSSFRRRKKAEYEDLVRRSRLRRNTGSSLLSASPSFRSSSPTPSVSTFASGWAPSLSMTNFVEGHWRGEVKIVRNAAPKGRSGVVDMYGNYFEKGYLYP